MSGDRRNFLCRQLNWHETRLGCHGRHGVETPDHRVKSAHARAENEHISANYRHKVFTNNWRLTSAWIRNARSAPPKKRLKQNGLAWDTDLVVKESSLKDSQQTSQNGIQRETKHVSASAHSADSAAKPSKTRSRKLVGLCTKIQTAEELADKKTKTKKKGLFYSVWVHGKVSANIKAYERFYLSPVGRLIGSHSSDFFFFINSTFPRIHATTLTPSSKHTLENWWTDGSTK